MVYWKVSGPWLSLENSHRPVVLSCHGCVCMGWIASFGALLQLCRSAISISCSSSSYSSPLVESTTTLSCYMLWCPRAGQWRPRTCWRRPPNRTITSASPALSSFLLTTWVSWQIVSKVLHGKKVRVICCKYAGFNDVPWNNPKLYAPNLAKLAARGIRLVSVGSRLR